MSGVIVVGHPSADLYGSDRQMLSTVQGLCARGWRVIVVLPASGPLVDRLMQAGAQVLFESLPVVRKSEATPRGVLRLALRSTEAVGRLTRLLRRIQPDVVLANTVTVPVWIAAARLAKTPVVVHVHEAEEVSNPVVRRLLYGPMLLADRVIANSAATRSVLLGAVPGLSSRVVVVLNGLPVPPDPGPPARSRSPVRVLVVGRLSPRKGVHVALDAVAKLRASGAQIEVDVCGSVFPGYEWYEEELRLSASREPLAGHVQFHGYVDPVDPFIERSRVVVMPTAGESFGNAAAEALLRSRPVVASDVQGLRDVVRHGETGLLVEAGNSQKLAAAIDLLTSDDRLVESFARAGRVDAVDRFSEARYQAEMAGLLSEVAGSDRSSRGHR